MGSPEEEQGRAADETQHTVLISRPFYICTTEVTQAQWEKVWGQPYDISPMPADRPVALLPYPMAVRFCKELSTRDGRTYRLPTEAEWEYACRAGTSTAWFFGKDVSKLKEYAWVDADASGMLHPVGQLKPNPWGLCDVYGNASEWVSDTYEPYTRREVADPRVITGGEMQVSRGGMSGVHSADVLQFMRSAARERQPLYGDAGMRIVCELPPKHDGGWAKR